MKVLTTYYTGDERNDYHEAMEITFDDKEMFYVGDGEPEDSNMNRDFYQVKNIPALLKEVYLLGKHGEEVIFEEDERFIFEEDER